ncbi:unnamed protein product [Amoebophrya sp. A120]|nr:unnamed protein product [Amoebophrya sp. A120]|eukprot:GSA120T00001328001.1
MVLSPSPGVMSPGGQHAKSPMHGEMNSTNKAAGGLSTPRRSMTRISSLMGGSSPLELPSPQVQEVAAELLAEDQEQDLQQKLPARLHELRETQQDSIKTQAEIEQYKTAYRPQTEDRLFGSVRRKDVKKPLSPRAQKVRDMLDSFYRGTRTSAGTTNTNGGFNTTTGQLVIHQPHHQGTTTATTATHGQHPFMTTTGTAFSFSSDSDSQNHHIAGGRFDKFERYTFGERGFNAMADHFRLGGILHPGHGLEGGQMPEASVPHMEWVPTQEVHTQPGVMAPKKKKKKTPFWCRKTPVLTDYNRMDAAVGIPQAKIFNDSQKDSIERLMKNLSCRRTVYSGAIFRPQTVTQEAYEQSLGYGGPGSYGIPKPAAIQDLAAQRRTRRSKRFMPKTSWLSDSLSWDGRLNQHYTNHRGARRSMSTGGGLMSASSSGAGGSIAGARSGAPTSAGNAALLEQQLHDEFGIVPAEEYRLGSVFNDTILADQMR